MNPENTKKYQSRLWIFYGLLIVFMSILYGGLFYRQLVESESHTNREKIQNQRRILTPGPRGNLLDREGRVLVANRSKFSAVVFLSDDLVQSAFHNHYRSLVRDYRERGETIESYSQLRIHSRAMVLQSYLSEVNRLIGRQLEVDANDISRHLYVNPLLPYPLVENLAPSEFALLNRSLLSPVQVYVSNMRISTKRRGPCLDTWVPPRSKTARKRAPTFATKGPMKEWRRKAIRPGITGKDRVRNLGSRSKRLSS